MHDERPVDVWPDPGDRVQPDGMPDTTPPAARSDLLATSADLISRANDLVAESRRILERIRREREERPAAARPPGARTITGS
nr:hypothetical protein GCM10020063_036200 [Dactylosporangium thailandense]